MFSFFGNIYDIFLSLAQGNHVVAIQLITGSACLVAAVILITVAQIFFRDK